MPKNNKPSDSSPKKQPASPYTPNANGSKGIDWGAMADKAMTAISPNMSKLRKFGNK